LRIVKPYLFAKSFIVYFHGTVPKKA